MRLTRAVAVVAVLSTALLAGPTASAPSAADPRTMVLQPVDLQGFTRTAGRYVSNAQANRESRVKKDFAKLGRLRGYEASYEREEAKGLLFVTSRASTYRTATGAHASLAATTAAVEATEEIDFRRVPVARIGNEARLYRATVTENGTRVDTYSLVWRSGSVLASVHGAGVAGTFARGEVVALARKQQTRVAAG